MPESVTACVIAANEERRLPNCLASLEFCDEIVVVDGGSLDRTSEIAREAGALVIENPWPGFAAQRNIALDHAHGDWILEIDADERVSPPLATEIRALLAAPPADFRMAAIPMRDRFLGAPLGRSARYPRYRHRLFRREAFRHDESRTVHEGLWPDGPVTTLNGELEHVLAGSWREAAADTVAYARLESGQRPRPSPGAALTVGLARPAAKFAYRYVLYGGWRDGLRGLAKIGLECAADSLAVLYGLRGPSGRDGSVSAPPRLGPVRLVGIGLDPKRAAPLGEWLREARAAGADVSLICRGVEGGEIPGRTLEGRGLGALARALDAEDQIRPIDALVLAGGHERRLLALLPRGPQGVVAPRTTKEPPDAAVAEVRRASRSG